MIALKDYQERAADRLREAAERLLTTDRQKSLVFQAPTGSGKTVVVAEFLKRLVENREDDQRFSFIWTAPRHLHTQSKEKLEQYYFDSKVIRCINYEDIEDKEIGDKEILFLNWESINKEDNIIVRENEQDFNLSTVLDNTIEAGRTVVLIIDESHYSAKTERAFDLIANSIKPQLILEVSATPWKRGDEGVTIQREEVTAEEMIKSLVSINPGFNNKIRYGLADLGRVESSLAESTDEFVLRMALDQRNRMQRLLEEEGSKVIPLLLIQIPDKHLGETDRKDEIIAILKDRHKITTDNGKLAIYLSEDKQNLEAITQHECEVEVMIFKQAIALGWDCPRAAVLVLFREWKSFTFSIQTLGRILRMPELKYYKVSELNNAYVFTNLADFSIAREVADFTSIYSSRLRENVSLVFLKSYHSKRFREETRLSTDFIEMFVQAAEEQELKKKINTKVSGVGKSLLTDGFIGDVDTKIEHLADPHTEHSFGGELTQRRMLPTEVQRVFDDFIKGNLAPFAPEQRSIGRLKEALYRFLQTAFPMEITMGDLHSQYVILNNVNRKKFEDAISRAKILYQAKVGKGKRELLVNEEWSIRRLDTHSGDFKSRSMNRCAVEPFYERDNASSHEQNFAKFLDDDLAGVDWWYKNGERDAVYFAVKYLDNLGNEFPFYVDWIVRFVDGRIGLFDTKGGITAKEAKAKAEGLAKYIREQNQSGKNLCGGIVIWERSSWMLNDNEVYEYNPNDLTAWKFVSQLGTGFKLG